MKRLATALLGLTLGLAGCGQATNPGSTLDDGRAAADSSLVGGGLGASCDGAGTMATSPTFTRLPADAVLVSARRCVYSSEMVKGDGEWMFKVEQQATAGLANLATALRMPSENMPPGQTVCPAVGYAPIIITVVDQQHRTFTPELPHQACGAPLKAATEAIGLLPWNTTTKTKLRQLRTQLEIDSGCAGLWKQMISITESDVPRPPSVGPAQLNLRPPLRICRYDLDPDPDYQISAAGSAPVRGGRLASVSTLDGSRAELFLAAVTVAPPVFDTCSQRESPFAVVWSLDRTGGTVTVELEGCHRVLLDSDSSVLRQLSADAVSVVKT